MASLAEEQIPAFDDVIDEYDDDSHAESPIEYPEDFDDDATEPQRDHDDGTHIHTSTWPNSEGEKFRPAKVSTTTSDAQGGIASATTEYMWSKTATASNFHSNGNPTQSYTSLTQPTALSESYTHLLHLRRRLERMQAQRAALDQSDTTSATYVYESMSAVRAYIQRMKQQMGRDR